MVRSHSHRPPSTQPRASSLALSCLSVLIYKLGVLLIIQPASGCRRDHPSHYVCCACDDDPGLWQVPPPWRWFLEAHGSQAPPLYMRDSGIHGFQLSARAPAANCPWMPAYTGSSAFGPARETRGSDGMLRTAAGRTRTATRATAATSGTGLPAREQRTGGCPTRGTDAQDEGSSSYLCTLVAFQARKPQGPFLSLQRKDKTRRH